MGQVCGDRLALCTGGDCHFKHAPGQGNIVQNTMSDHGTKRNKIRKKKALKRYGVSQDCRSYWDLFTLHLPDDHWQTLMPSHNKNAIKN